VEGGCANDYVYVFGDPINTTDLDGRGVCKNVVVKAFVNVFSAGSYIRGAYEGLRKRFVKAAKQVFLFPSVKYGTAFYVLIVGGGTAVKTYVKALIIPTVAASIIDAVCTLNNEAKKAKRERGG